MSILATLNSTVSNAVNKLDVNYKALVGDPDSVPETVIVESSDFNCGAICNELEFARTVSEFYVRSLGIELAGGDALEMLATSFIYLPRLTRSEQDSIYRKRFRTIVNQYGNTRRTTRWALLDALRYFIANVTDAVQVIELFEVQDTHFELRIEGTATYDDAVFLDNPETGFLDQNFVGGEGIGDAISYIGELVDRIKAAGVDYDIVFIRQDRFTKTSGMVIGSVQQYKGVNATVLRHESFGKTCNATIV